MSREVMNASLPSYAMAAVVMLLLAPLSPAYAGGKAPESAKAEAIKRIMTGRMFYPQDSINSDNPGFCKAFLTDFRKQEAIEYVDPILGAKSYDDPALEPYKARCPQLDLHKSWACGNPISDYLETLPAKEAERTRDELCDFYYGSDYFKFYRVDLNNEPDDGKEYVFFYAGSIGPFNKQDDSRSGTRRARHTPGGGVYGIVDFGKCEFTTGAGTGGHNAMIKYRDKVYIYNLDASDEYPDNYFLTLNGYRERLKRIVPICAFDPIDIPTKN